MEHQNLPTINDNSGSAQAEPTAVTHTQPNMSVD
jgi:hypothetical protein